MRNRKRLSTHKKRGIWKRKSVATLGTGPRSRIKYGLGKQGSNRLEWLGKLSDRAHKLER